MPTTMEVEKARFYYEMRNTVVIVECSYERQPPLKYFDINDKEQSSYAKLVDRFASKEKTGVLTKRFGGVFIDQQGYVLTVANAIPLHFKKITLWTFEEGQHLSAKLIDKNLTMNLALLKAEGWLAGTFPLLRDAPCLMPGNQLFSISHPPKMIFSFETGEVGYPYSCEEVLGFQNRTVADVVNTPGSSCHDIFVKMEEDEEHGILLGMSQDSPLLQMSKFFGTMALSPWNDILDPQYSDSQGAPIFDDKGRLVGIFAFTLRRRSFSIPFGVIKEYLEMTIPKRVLDKFSPSALQSTDGVKMEADMYINQDLPSPTKNTALYNKMCKVVVMVECKSKISNKAMLTAHFGGVVVNEKGHVLVVSHALPLRKEDIVEMNIRKVGDETVWPAVCVAKDPKRGLALLKVEVKEGDEFCILSQEELILPGKKIFCLSQLSGMPFSFECGEVSYPHLASGEKGKSFQNRTVDDVKSMWDDGGLRNHLMMADNKSSILVSMDGNIPLLQMSKFTGSLALMNFNITEEARRYDSQGTPIFGIEGEVIGIFAFSISKISFAIPFEVVKAFLSDQLPS